VVETEGAEILLNEAYIKQYIKALERLRDEFGLKDDITVSRIAQNKDVFSVKTPEEDIEKDKKDAERLRKFDKITNWVCGILILAAAAIAVYQILVTFVFK
jgi:uncharacterized protein YicC (UPF0701 family)